MFCMMVRNYIKINAIPLILFCAFLFLTAAVLPAGAQIFTAPEPELTGTPSPEGISAVKETPVPAEIYMQKIFVPTNTPADADFTIIIPNNEREDTPDADKTEGNSSDTFRQVKLNLKMMKSFKLTAGKIWNNNPSENGMLYAVDVNSEKTAIEIETIYDSSIGNIAAAYTNTNRYNTLNGTALKVNSNSPFKAKIGDSVSTILTNKKQNFTEYKVKAIEVREAVSTAEVSVFGNAIAKVETPTPEAGQTGDSSAAFTGTIHAAAVDLIASQNGNITADIGGVTARASGANSAYVTGVCISDDKEDESAGNVSFTSANPDYYFFRNTTSGAEVVPQPLNGDISASAAVTGNAWVYGALLTAHNKGSVIDFETGTNGGIYAGAAGSGGSVYGLYTDSSDGIINAIIGGSVVEGVAFYDDTSEPAVLTGADLGNTAGILMAGNSGQVNIQVGVVPDEPPVGEKEIKVSGSQVGIYNTSTNGQTKNVVIFGTVTGAAAPILSDSTGGSSFTLAAWAIDQKDGHVALTKTKAADTEFEKDIRYIILEDPSIAGQVKLEDVSSAKDAQDETYYWANAGETVTLKSNEEGTHITEAYWGLGENDKMECSGGTCTFTVPMGGSVWIHNVKTAKDTELYADKYITVAGENQAHEIGSGQDAVFIIERIENDDLTYPLFRTIIQLKNSKNELFPLSYPDDYDYLEGSLIVKLHADYLDNLPPDNYTLRAFFEDGIYEISFTISEESPYKLNVEFRNSQNNGNKRTPDGIKILPLIVKISIIQNGKVISESKMWPVNLDGSEDNETLSKDVSFLSQIPDLTDGSYTASVSILPVNITLGGVEYKLSAKARVDSNGKILVDLLWDDGSREEEEGMVFYLLPFYKYGLPATGFSSLFTNTSPEQPMALNYEPVRLRLQIPTLSLETELVTVPLMNDTWQVEWLGNRAGLLEGSALPGEEYSFIAAHNTLNSEEYGPFALLSTMAPNDLITVNNEDSTMKLFRVYANELIGADDVQKLEKIAEQEADSLVLITCENESADSGYLDRRVIFAKPL